MRRAPLLIPALVACALLALCHIRAPAIDHEIATTRYIGVVIGDTRDEEERTATLLALEGPGVVRTTLDAPVVPGERVTVRGRIEPFDEPRNPGEPSMREIEADDGIVARLASARLLARGGVDAWDTRAWGARIRAVFSHRIRAVVPEPSATILAGALWGERGTLPDDLHDAFQATGTVHVLVTAGLHLGIVAGLIVVCLGRLGLHRSVTCAAAFALIVAYAWLTGAHLPAVRGTAMIGIALLARACGARVASWNALAFGALVVAAIAPWSVASASFALSFSCVAAIVLVAEPITEALGRLRLPERLREAIALTCATQLGTWPLTAAIFATLAPYAVVANAIVVPLVAIALPLGMATLAVPALAPLVTITLLAIEAAVRAFAAWPAAHAWIASPSPLAIAGYDLSLVAAALAFRHARGWAALGCVVAAFACVLAPATLARSHGLTITHLDVGQADAAVIRTPGNRTILIDTGGELERGDGPSSLAERAGARIVLGYLRREGIQRVDLMLLTHPHGDHVGGCSPIIEAMPVGVLYDSGQTYSGRAYRDCIASAHAHHVPIVIARRGMQWSSDDGVTLDMLAPSLPFLADTGDDVNENSIVAMLHYEAYRELFMGDAGEDSEARLFGFGDDLRADVLKVGHHGSQYASTPAFIAAVHPHTAIISVGRHNTFGHPGPSTLATLAHFGATIYRTDHCGALRLDVDAGTALSTFTCHTRK